jgi:putative ABC transport system substrate-binding protein
VKIGGLDGPPMTPDARKRPGAAETLLEWGGISVIASRWVAIASLLAMLVLLAWASLGDAQHTRIYRVGVISQGGPFALAVDGLREGLAELGFEEGKHFVLQVRDAKGDLKAVETAARELERDNVDLIYTLAASVTLATKRATSRVPIVFYAGSDPQAYGLVDNVRKPGGRLTGIHSRFNELTAKRLELLKEMVPRIRRVAVFYSPDNPMAEASLRVARDAARQLKLEIVERRIASVDDLRAGLRALRPGEVDAISYLTDAVVQSHSQLIVEAATAKKLPTMFQEQATVAGGGLASYGVRFATAGRLSAKQVHRVLLGAKPGDLPVEHLDRLHFVINLKTARALGLTIPRSMLARADEIIE